MLLQRRGAEISITRRKSVAGNADRLTLVDELDNLRFWAKQNPPVGCRVILPGIAKPKSKSASGIKSFRRRGRMKEALDYCSGRKMQGSA
jgi:hypothetical protein